jgi:hypothetical protein
MRANYQQDEFDGSNTWRFESHQTVFDMHQPTPQDFLWKIVVPSSERGKVLMLLDDFNLNAYSLFVSVHACGGIFGSTRSVGLRCG